MVKTLSNSKTLAMAAKAKAKMNALGVAAASTVSAGLASVGLGFCDVDANNSMKNFLTTMFNVIMFAGIILAVAGAVTLIRTIISMSSGEQAQPGALGKCIGLLVGGIVLMAAKALITAIIGQDPTSMTFI